MFPPYKSLRDQIWPCCKIGQGQPRVIIWTNYDGPRVPNATYQATRSLALWFWRRRFLKGFTIYGRGGHLGQVTQTLQTNFHSPIPLRLLKLHCSKIIWTKIFSNFEMALKFKLDNNISSLSKHCYLHESKRNMTSFMKCIMLSKPR